MKNVLTIAGSDCSGGAGIQADLKTMCALGVYGMSAITAVTAQNTQAVYGVQEIDAAIVEEQIKVIFEDIRVDAVKVGMVSSAVIIRAVRDSLLAAGARNIVVDPVMVSKSGYPLLKEEAVQALHGLIEIADVVTPNIPEAEILAGFPVRTEENMRRAAGAIVKQGVKSVLIKGGHRLTEGTENDEDRMAGEGREPEAVDLLFAEGQAVFFRAKRIDTRNTHGTGCTLSAAIACRLALGDTVEEAVRTAKDYITQAIADSYGVGKGPGPVGHLAALYRRAGM